MTVKRAQSIAHRTTGELVKLREEIRATTGFPRMHHDGQPSFSTRLYRAVCDELRSRQTAQDE